MRRSTYFLCPPAKRSRIVERDAIPEPRLISTKSGPNLYKLYSPNSTAGTRDTGLWDRMKRNLSNSYEYVFIYISLLTESSFPQQRTGENTVAHLHSLLMHSACFSSEWRVFPSSSLRRSRVGTGVATLPMPSTHITLLLPSSYMSQTTAKVRSKD